MVGLALQMGAGREQSQERNEEGFLGLPSLHAVPSYLPKLMGTVHRLSIVIWSPAVERHPVGRARARLWLPTQAPQAQPAVPPPGPFLSSQGLQLRTPTMKGHRGQRSSPHSEVENRSTC